jgi:hypothetical protein
LAGKVGKTRQGAATGGSSGMNWAIVALLGEQSPQWHRFLFPGGLKRGKNRGQFIFRSSEVKL